MSKWTDFSRSACDDNWLPAGSLPPVSIYAGRGPCRRLLYVTKNIPSLPIFTRNVPPGIRIIQRYGLASPRYAAIVRRECKASGVPALFVGDLDPYDLSVFASLKHGGGEMVFRKRSAAPVEYFGINDAWLSLCQSEAIDRDAIEPSSTAGCFVRMSYFERHHFDILQEFLSIEELVGPRCAGILRNGYKLELDGATAPRLYRDTFATKLWNLLVAPGAGGEP